MSRPALLIALVSSLALGGCATTVLQQRVPVSTDPPGATATDDSGSRCITPCALDLDRNRDHIVAISMPGHEHENIIIRRQYRTADVMLSAINAGLSSARTFNNAAWALQSGMANKSAQEQSGAAYTLEPTVISLRLRPQGVTTVVPGVGGQNAGTVASPTLLGWLERDDELMLEQALESTAAGAPMAWTNPRTSRRFTVVPGNVELREGQVVRPFVLSRDNGPESQSARLYATRVGRGEWQVLAPPAGPTADPAFTPLPLGETHRNASHLGTDLGRPAR